MTIRCKALALGEMFVTAKGDILPCCYMYRGGPALEPWLQEIIKEESFDSLVASWDSSTPNRVCYITCDDGQTNNPLNVSNFDKQWKK